ncbi:hypothetical protein [Parvibaculum sp. MBR-TMA-1.3b-4.2]|jgi:hypothetical protein
MIRRTAMLFSLAIVMLAPLISAPARSAEIAEEYAPGTRSGPFVVTDRSLADLAADGYEVKTGFGRALILQKEASIYSCEVPPARKTLSYASYFVCSELKEARPGAGENEEPADDGAKDDNKKN